MVRGPVMLSSDPTVKFCTLRLAVAVVHTAPLQPRSRPDCALAVREVPTIDTIAAEAAIATHHCNSENRDVTLVLPARRRDGERAESKRPPPYPTRQRQFCSHCYRAETGPGEQMAQKTARPTSEILAEIVRAIHVR
jgi:hypothetical protein